MGGPTLHRYTISIFSSYLNYVIILDFLKESQKLNNVISGLPYIYYMNLKKNQKS